MRFSLLKWVWVGFCLLVMSLLIMLATGQFQLYFRTAVDSYEDIKIGFPFHYYSFSRDGNNFHGGSGKHLIIDYLLTLTFTTVMYVIGRIVVNYFSGKIKANQEEYEIID